MKFKKKSKALHLGQHNWRAQDQLRSVWQESSFAERDPEGTQCLGAQPTEQQLADADAAANVDWILSCILSK